MPQNRSSVRVTRFPIFFLLGLGLVNAARAQESVDSSTEGQSQQGEVLPVQGSPKLENPAATALLELIDVKKGTSGDQEEVRAGEFLQLLLKYKTELDDVFKKFKSAHTTDEHGELAMVFLKNVFLPLMSDLEAGGFLEDPEIKDNDTIAGFLRVYNQIQDAQGILELVTNLRQVEDCLRAIQRSTSAAEAVAEARKLVELLRPLRQLRDSQSYPTITNQPAFTAFERVYDEAVEVIGAAQQVDARVLDFRTTLSELSSKDTLRRQMQNFVLSTLVEAVNKEFDLGITAQTVDQFVEILRDPAFYADLFVTNVLREWVNENASYTYNVNENQSVTIRLLLNEGTSVRIFSRKKQVEAPLRCELIYQDNDSDSVVSGIVVVAKGIAFQYEGGRDGGQYSLNFDNLEVDADESLQETIKANIAGWINQCLKESGVAVTVTVTKYPDRDPAMECDLAVEFSGSLKIDIRKVRFYGNRLGVNDTTIRVTYELQPPLELGCSICFHEFGGYARPGHREFGPTMKLGSTYFDPDVLHVRICGSAKVPEEFGDGAKLFRHILDLAGEMKKERPGLAKNTMLRMKDLFQQQQYLNHTGGLYIFEQKLSHFIGHTDFATGKMWGKYIRGRRNSWKKVAKGKTTEPQAGEEWEWVYGDWSGDETSELKYRDEKYDIRLALEDQKKHFDEYCCGSEMIEARVSHQGRDYNLAYKEGKFTLENGVLVMTGEVELFGQDCDTITTLVDFEKGRAMITADKGVELFGEDFAPSLTGELLFDEKKLIVEGTQIVVLPVPPFVSVRQTASWRGP